MKLAAALLLAAALAAPALAGYDEEGLSEAPVADTGTAKTAPADGDAGEAQPFVQETDEDLADLVMDYVRRDTALKGSFLIEDKAAKKVMKLTLVALDTAAKDGEEGEKTVASVFRDEAGRKYAVVFHLQSGPWGGLDIFRLELKPAAAPAKAGRKK